jgi:26S proteasome regulatory subunit N7
MADDIVLPIPNLELPQQLFIISTFSLTHLHRYAAEKLWAGIQADNMAPYYRLLTSITPAHPVLPEPVTVIQESIVKMEQTNKDELDKLDERLKEAEKTEGESEISDALKARANYLTKIGDKVRLHRYSAYVGPNALILLWLA